MTDRPALAEIEIIPAMIKAGKPDKPLAYIPGQPYAPPPGLDRETWMRAVRAVALWEDSEENPFDIVFELFCIFRDG
jgi:hypothetical protein